MAPNFFLMEAANLFCGDHDPTASKHLTLSEMQLPSLTEIFQDHHPGGSLFQVEVSVGVEKLLPTFKLAGHDPGVLSLFGLGTKRRHTFTSYGVIRDKRTGQALEAKAIIEGRLGSIEPETFQRGEMQSHDYAINEVMHYEFWWAGKEKFYFDFWTSEWRVDGVSQNADENRILRIGSGV
ncbi:phage major tail tube protein [Paracoccus sp. KR1-242]|uniref:phage major tail tube protein n=1 Tax=Paracoccus sp. KR1-242 TaxID=3410028 RepID=UPI003BFF81D7